MTESATYIADLDATLPAAATSPISADDHIRLLKSVLRASFPNISGAVTASDAELNIADGLTVTAAELNIMDGVTVTAAEIEFADALTSAVQTQIAAKSNALTVQVKTSNFTAATGFLYVCRSASAGLGPSFNATLPASASAGQQILIARQIDDDFAADVTILRNGHNINGSAANFSMGSVTTVKLVYVDSTTGWAKYDAL